MPWRERGRFTARMTAQHITPFPAGTHGRPGTRDGLAARDRYAWVAPLVATVLLCPLGPAAVFLGGLSVMATDGCGPDHCPQALTTSLEWIYGLLFFGAPVAFKAWVTAWALPWTRRWAAARAVAAAVSLLPLIVLLLVFSLPAP
ncbi:hypothetical protein GCM10010389_38160 [Streptomyces echinoruber]|uniref:Uncharacterized protein n=2 Tax=Streptomyces echinoruber TaxID=68898 RepID=A0A918RFF9_9ACTN|nr:hypothetical protein GCM10010389_38160 [Streptomyces echinoruber]